mgnify:CR=1 FL=1
MDRNEKIKVISQAIYDDYIKKGWKNVSIYDCEVKAMNYVDTEIIVKKLTLTDVVQQSEQFECDNGCDWYSVGHQLNGHQQCRKCGEQKAF